MFRWRYLVNTTYATYTGMDTDAEANGSSPDESKQRETTRQTDVHFCISVLADVYGQVHSTTDVHALSLRASGTAGSTHGSHMLCAMNACRRFVAVQVLQIAHTLGLPDARQCAAFSSGIGGLEYVCSATLHQEQVLAGRLFLDKGRWYCCALHGHGSTNIGWAVVIGAGAN